MVKGLFQVYLPENRNFWIYSCFYCRAHLALHEDLISKSFQGSQGRAYLFNDVVNVHFGDVKQRILLTGIHFVADVFCAGCQALLGWKYERAFEPSQRYKEGKVIIELAHLIKDNFWDRDLYNSKHGNNAFSSYWAGSTHREDEAHQIPCISDPPLQEHLSNTTVLSRDVDASSSDSIEPTAQCASSFDMTAADSSTVIFQRKDSVNSQSRHQLNDLRRPVLSSLNDNTIDCHGDHSDTALLLPDKDHANGMQASSSHSPIMQLLSASKNGWCLRKRLHRRAKSSSPSLDTLLASTGPNSDIDDSQRGEEKSQITHCPGG